MAALGFACECGTLRGEIVDASPSAYTHVKCHSYTHVKCHCSDCRAAYTHFGRDDPGTVDLLQTTQDRVRITHGGEKLRVFRHTPRGALRWYATCCDTPLFLTPLKPRLVHVSVNTDRLDAPGALGPVAAEGFIPAPGGKRRHKGVPRMIAGMVSRMASKNLSGEWRNTPFFDADGAPVVPPQVLSREERAAALMGVQG